MSGMSMTTKFQTKGFIDLMVKPLEFKWDRLVDLGFRDPSRLQLQMQLIFSKDVVVNIAVS